ncbi:MAG: hypothetical protein ACYC9M_06070 [Desulfobulbaceae bacterium]
MRFIKAALIAVTATLLLCSCSNDNDQKKEKGKIEAMTEKAGQDAVKAIKTPMEKAQTAADVAEKRTKEMNESKQE